MEEKILDGALKKKGHKQVETIGHTSS